MEIEPVSETQCFIKKLYNGQNPKKEKCVTQIVGSTIKIYSPGRPGDWDVCTPGLIFCYSKSRICLEVLTKTVDILMKTGVTSNAATCHLASNKQVCYLSTAIFDACPAS
jgi:hypothetical protein